MEERRADGMKLVIWLTALMIPVAMAFMGYYWRSAHVMMAAAASLSAYVVGGILGTTIYDVIRNDTVFMTEVHKVFLNPFFLITGAYLGVYLLYGLLLFTAQSMKKM